MAKVYYNEKICNRISKGNRQVEIWENPCTGFLMFSPSVRGHTKHVPSLAVKNIVTCSQCFCLGKHIRNSGP